MSRSKCSADVANSRSISCAHFNSSLVEVEVAAQEMFVPTSEGGGSAVSFDGYRVIVVSGAVVAVSIIALQLSVITLFNSFNPPFRPLVPSQPCVSVGNVAQLTVDLLINTLKLVRVGYLDDDSLLPLVGNDAFDHTRPAGHMHTAGEGLNNFKLQCMYT